MFRKPQPSCSASISIQVALALVFAAFSAACADTPSRMAQPTSTPSAATSTPSATTVSPSPTTVTPSAATISASAVTLSVGETVDGSLDDGDDRDYFRIKGEENRVYDLSVATGTLTAPIVVLYASDLSRMMESWGRPDTGEVRFVWPGYPRDFYVMVEGGDGGGTYTLTLAPFPEDHGDDIPFASQVGLGETVKGSMGYSHDFDYFRFRADAGQLYRVEVATSNRGCWIMRLWDSAEAILAFHPFSGDSGLIIWEATSSGDHYVEVMNSSGGHGCDSWEGEYTLTIAPMSLPSEDEHGNGVSSAALMGVGEPVSAGLDYAGDSDYFRFRAEKGRIYRMDVALGTLDRSSYEINLYGPDGDEIEWSPHSLRKSGYAWEAPAAGEYYVAVAASGNETGSYTLTVTPINDDHGEGRASATEVTLGEPIRGDTQYLGDRDYFRFRAEKARFYLIDASPPRTPSDWGASLQLQDSKGDEVRLWGKIWEAPETGDFYIGLETPYSMGAYVLTVSQIPAPPADDHANHRTAATALVVGEYVSGYTNYDGDVDHFRFTADTDQPYRIEVESRDLGHWSTELYDSTGRHLNRLLHLTTEDSRRWFTWKAPGRDVYYISVSGWDREGAYTLTVVPVTDDHGDSATSATALAAGNSVGGNIDYQGDTDYIKFRAEGGRTYRIEVFPDTLPGSTIRLYDSASQVLAVGWDRVKISCSDCGDDWVKNARQPIIWEAPTSGYYYVGVEARLETVGNYELAIGRLTE